MEIYSRHRVLSAVCALIRGSNGLCDSFGFPFLIRSWKVYERECFDNDKFV